MASLQSYATTASNVVVSTAKQLITIDNEVVEVDGVLDTIPPGWEIHCQNGGGIRLLAGSSGTLGGGSIPLVVREFETAHRFDQDNFNGSNGRFVGGSCKLSNVVWWSYCRSTGALSSTRSDFDVASGFAGEFNGLRHIATGGYNGSSDAVRCFTHFASASLKITRNQYTGYGVHLTNTENYTALELVRPPATFEDPVLVDSNPDNTANAHLAVRLDNVADNAHMTIKGLKARSIGTINSGSNYSTRGVRLEDPVGDIPRVAWSNEYDGYISIYRTQPFTFSGVQVPASTAIHATATAAGGDHAEGSASGAAGSILLLTKTAADGTATYTALNTYHFYMVGRAFRKYGTSTAVSIGTTPAAIAVALVPDVLPDGTALTAYAGSAAIQTASEFYRVCKDFELANPDTPSSVQSIATINSQGHIVLGFSIGLILSSSASDLIRESSNVLTLKTASSGLTADHGITLLDAGASSILQAGTLALLQMPVRSSTGTSSQITITAHASEFAAICTNAGADLGSNSFTQDGSWTRQIPAGSSLANTRIALLRPGYRSASRTLDLSSGGSYSVSFAALTQELDPEGGALYDSTADVSNLSTTTFAANGTAKINIGNAAVGVSSIYRKFHDDLATTAGARFAAFDRTPLGINVDAYNGNSLYLGGSIQLRRAAAANANAAVQAAVYGGTGGTPIDAARGEVYYKPGSDIARIQEALLVDFDLDPASAGTQSVAGLLTAIKTCSDQMIPAVETLNRQNRILIQSQPLLTFDPFSPDCAITAVPGLERVRDVESRNWPITPQGGTSVVQDGSGEISTNGAGSVRFDLYRRNDEGSLELYNAETILLLSIYPTSFHPSQYLSLASISGAGVRLAPSTGNTTSLALRNSNGHYATTQTIRLNQWNDLAIVFARNQYSDQYPFIHIAVDGDAPVSYNVDESQARGAIASSALHFSVGGLTNGFMGRMRALYFHPAQTLHGDTGWIPPRNLHYNADFVDWYAPGGISDRSEGGVWDRIEPVINDIDSKVLDEEGVRRATWESFINATASNGNNATNIQLLKWLVANMPPAAPTAQQNAAQLMATLIEEGIDFRKAQRITLGILGGPSAAAGARRTFRRLDAARTAILSGDEDGEGNRSNIEVEE